MGKLIVISGKNDSGKSLFAENLIAKYKGKRYYIATMIPKTADNCDRIEKHKNQRESLSFTTLELPYSLSEAIIEEDSAVLLEDVSNLLANNIFDKGVGCDKVLEDILNLTAKCSLVVAVTISHLVSSDYEGETAMYIDSLNKINEELRNRSCISVIMENGKAVYEKGEENDIF